MDEYVRKIGSENKKKFDEDYDKFFDLYTQKGKDLGYEGELKFTVEKGKVIIFVVI